MSEIVSYEDIVPPANKRGRKPGGKNRPKWLIAEMKKHKRPRGRPRKGQENDLTKFLLESLANTPDKPPPFRKPKPPVDPEYKRIVNERLNGGLTKEEHSERSRKGAYARKTHGSVGAGAPPGWTKREYMLATEIAKTEAQRILKRMEKDSGELLPEDQLARECLKTAYEIMRSPTKPADKLKAIKTILEFTKAKPATKSDVTVRTAEDFLDELMNKSGNSGS